MLFLSFPMDTSRGLPQVSLILLLLLLPLTVHAATSAVSPTGSDTAAWSEVQR